MIGARDPFGLKPLCIGKRDNTYFLASESCAIAAVGGEFVRDVEPGEIVSFTKHGMKSDKTMAIDPKKQARCIFEYIYFARMDSVIDDVNVYHARIVAGKLWQNLIRLMRIWLSEYRIPGWLRRKDIRNSREFRMAWHSTRTVMSEEHLSSQNRVSGKAV